MGVSAIKQEPLNTAVYVRQDILGRRVQQVSQRIIIPHNNIKMDKVHTLFFTNLIVLRGL